MEDTQSPETKPIVRRGDSGIGNDMNSTTSSALTERSTSPPKNGILSKITLPKAFSSTERRKSSDKTSPTERPKDYDISPPIAGSGKKLSVDASICDLQHPERRNLGQAHTICGAEHCICETAEAVGLSHQQQNNNRRSSEKEPPLPAFVRRNKPETLIGVDNELQRDPNGLTRVQRHGDW